MGRTDVVDIEWRGFLTWVVGTSLFSRPRLLRLSKPPHFHTTQPPPTSTPTDADEADVDTAVIDLTRQTGLLSPQPQRLMGFNYLENNGLLLTLCRFFLRFHWFAFCILESISKF